MNKTFYIPPSLAGQKIDRALMSCDLGVSRRRIRQLLDRGLVWVNGKKVTFASYRVREKDSLEITASKEFWEGKSTKVSLSLTEPLVLFEDSSLVVINKPAPISCQKERSTKSQWVEGFLAAYLTEKDPTFQSALAVCHRLDKETTGALILAKDKKTLAEVMEQFKQKAISKKYWALCLGIPAQKQWQVDNHLSALDKRQGKVKSVRSGGKRAITDFKLLASCPQKNISLVECLPVTGRSHQLRVHLSDMGLPILGDKKYTQLHHQKKSSLFTEVFHHQLHAKKITFRHQNSQLEIEAPLPKVFRSTLKDLKFSPSDR